MYSGHFTHVPWTSKLYAYVQYCGGVDAQTVDFFDKSPSTSPKDQPTILIPQSNTSQAESTILFTDDEDCVDSNHIHQIRQLPIEEFATAKLVDSPIELGDGDTLNFLRDSYNPNPNYNSTPFPRAPITDVNVSSVYSKPLHMIEEDNTDGDDEELNYSVVSPESKEDNVSDSEQSQQSEEESESDSESEEEEGGHLNECISNLLETVLSEEIKAILGDPSTYKLPTKRRNLERDLRKIKTSLKTVNDGAQRIYAKITILKHYKLLTLIYRKYCKIGGDMNWLTLKGWIAMLRDARLIDAANDNEESRQLFIDLFYRVYDNHNHSNSNHSNSNQSKSNNDTESKSHHLFPSISGFNVELSDLYGDDAFYDNDPWTGLWTLQKQHEVQDGYSTSSGHSDPDHSDESALQCFKFRKIGDLRIAGCTINGTESTNHGLIRGTLNKENFKNATLDIRFRRRKRVQSRRVWNCTLIPPTTPQDVITMKVEWTEHKKGAAATGHGHLKLFKCSELNNDDEDLPSSQFKGLSRHEFIDTILAASTLIPPSTEYESTNKCNNQLYALCDRLVVEYLSPYIYINTMDIREHIKGEKMVKSIEQQIQKEKSMLVKLFKSYALQHRDYLDLKQWTLMATKLCEAAVISDRFVWSKGGRPKKRDIVHCFLLSKRPHQLDEDEISLRGFHRCLVYFAGCIFPKQAKTKYTERSFEEKMKLVLKWCGKLGAQKRRSVMQRMKSRSSHFRNSKKLNQSSNDLRDDQMLSVSTRMSLSQSHD